MVQEYLPAAEPSITRVESVGGEYLYAVPVDTSEGGFELCPADSCGIPGAPDVTRFQLRRGFDASPLIPRFPRRHRR